LPLLKIQPSYIFVWHSSPTWPLAASFWGF